MSFQGVGTGSINYQIQNEQSVNAQCVVQALEDDSSGTLTLNVSFIDATHGQVQVGISLFNYSPSTTTYNNIAYLMIGFNCQTPLGGWASNSGSSAFLYVNQQSGGSGVSYSGSFNASNLMWAGMGFQNSLAIKFASFSFQVSADPAAVEGFNYRTGAGTGTVTYQIGAAPGETTAATASTVSYYNNGVIYSVILNLHWTDPVQGDVVTMLIVNPFTGTGIYPSPTMMFSTALAGSGNWTNGDVTLDAIYNEQPSVASWQGSLAARNLVWQGAGSQPNLTVILSALTLTVQIS
ncbi:MAG: hypothetical protein ABSF22_11100 [Bryobacteraceae bacterium]